MSGWALTTYGVLALTFMMTMYGLEGRSPRFVLAFAVGCVLASSYGFLSGAWPFGVVEAIWALVSMLRRSWLILANTAGGAGSAGPPGRQTGDSPDIRTSESNRIEGQEKE